ncbi:MAG: hypothetical protein ACE5FV_04500 [Woeseia sp.]
MDKKFLISWLVIFVVWMAGSFIVHGLLLQADYGALPNLMRTETETQALFHWMVLAHILLAGAFVWIYNRGKEDKPWVQQGIRFGIAIAVLAAIPTYMVYYVVQPTPGILAIKQMIFESVLIVILGIVVAFLNKPQAAASATE